MPNHLGLESIRSMIMVHRSSWSMIFGRRVWVSLERVRVQEVEHMKDAKDSKSARQQHQEKEPKGHRVTMDQEVHSRKEKSSEEGEKGGQEETLQLWNGVS